MTEITLLPNLMTSAEVAELLSVDASTLSKWRSTNRGPLPVVWLTPSTPRYRRRDVEALVTAMAA